MLADLHTHSIYSFDGKPAATMENIAEHAIAAGLSHVAVTDHCDIDDELAGIYKLLDKEAVYAAVTAAKEKYRGRVGILFGIELGQAHYCPAESHALLARYPYDFVLGSIHNLRNMPDFSLLDYARLDDDEVRALYDTALDEELGLCDFEGVHALGHLNYPERYLHRLGRTLDLAPHREKLYRLFEKIMEKGLTVELNTSVMGDGLAMPGEEMLRLYREAGGSRVCLGSDAHDPAKIAQNFEAGCALLRSCGFTDLTLPTVAGVCTYPIPRRIHHA